jgi:hypothetical protein
MKDILRNPRVVTLVTFLGLGGLGIAGCGGSNDRSSGEQVRYPEIEQFGANTFKNYEHVDGVGYPLEIGQRVVVDCLASGPVAAAPSAEGKWYHIVAPEKYKDYYAAANTFENGDTSGPPSEQPAVDPNVPDC